MRRLTPRYKQWLRFRARNEARRKGHRGVWKIALIATQFGERLARVRTDDVLPPILCLERELEQTVGFVYDLRVRTSKLPSALIRRQMVKHRGRIGWVRDYQDFKSLKEISLGAALLLAAEYDRARILGGFPLATVDLRGWDPKVYETLRMLRFFDLLNLPQQPPEEPLEGFYVEPLASEMAANSQPAIDRIIALFEKAGGDMRLRLALCGAVVDALENVRDHAYPQDAFVDVKHVPKWWFTGAAYKGDRSLVLAVYDQGISIPVTLPRRFGIDLVKASFERWFGLLFDLKDSRNDGAALDAAMRLSATSTTEHYRGKGLAKIRQVVSECHGGRLRIVSRNGEYIFDGRNTRTNNMPVMLPGTYVEIAASF
jgi:hypothetical protein